MLILFFSWIFSLNSWAKDPICTAEQIGTVVGTVDEREILALAKLTNEGLLQANTTKNTPPCFPPNSLAATLALDKPLKLVGVTESATQEALVGTIGYVTCGEGYVFCVNEKVCNFPNFSPKIFFNEQAGAAIKKVNRPGKVEDLPESVWQKVESSLQQKIRTSYASGYGYYKGIPGKRRYRAVQNITLAKNKSAKLAILALESTQAKFIEKIPEASSQTTSHNVVGIVVVSDPAKIDASSMFTFSAGQEIEKSKELKFLIVAEYGKYTVLVFREYTEYFLQSLDQTGKVLSQIAVSNGQSECD